MMKVLHFINTLSAGGAELHLLTLCQHLKQEGIEVVVAHLKEGRGSRPLRSDFEAAGIQVVPLMGKRVWDLRYLLHAANLIRKERPDLLHTHLPRADLVGFLFRLLNPSLPWTCSVHAIHSKSWRARWALPLFRYVWRRADRVIAISEAVKAWLVHDYGLSSERVYVVHYGIDAERFAAPAADLRLAWGLGERVIIGSIGRLVPIKGHDLLIRAMPIVLRQVPNAALLIAGHDPWGYGVELHMLIQRLRLGGRVRLIGFQEDVPSFLHALNVFAFASRSEGFGQVLIEAMAAGKPVIASKIPPLTEIVVDGKTGLLVKPDDPKAFAEAIAWLLTHPKQAQRMGKYGQERVFAEFSAETMTNKILSLYQVLLDEVYCHST